MPVAQAARHTRRAPCTVCGGYAELESGRGIRCWGFRSSDGAWEHCTRPEYAGAIEQHASSLTYPHRLEGSCRCGRSHTEAAPMVMGPLRKTHTRGGEPAGIVVETYPYRDEAGRFVHRTVRYANPKSFAQQRYQWGDWRWGLAGTKRYLYHLPELLRSDPRDPVFLPEGEKDVEALLARGLVATTNPCGAADWRDHYGAWLGGRPVVILEDHDSAGRSRTRRISSALRGLVPRLTVLRFAGLPEGADVSDWFAAGGTADGLLESIGYRAPLRIAG